MRNRTRPLLRAGVIGLLAGLLFFLLEMSIRFLYLFVRADEQPPSMYLLFMLYYSLLGLVMGLGIFRLAPLFRIVSRSRIRTMCASAIALAATAIIAAVIGARLDLSPAAALRHLAAALLLCGAVAALGMLLVRLASRYHLRHLIIGLGSLSLMIITCHLMILRSSPIKRLLPQSQKPGAAPNAPNILLLTIDTLRADHLGVYGYHGTTSHHIDLLARESALFQNAIAQSPWTQPSFGSILTSTYPSQHGAFMMVEPETTENGDVIDRILYRSSLRDDVSTMAEILSDHGYLTVALQTNWSASEAQKFDRGFDLFLHQALFTPPMRDRCLLGTYGQRILKLFGAEPYESYLNRWPNADEVYRSFAALFSDGLPRPFFIWMNFIDPHGPYLSRERDVPVEKARVIASHDPWDASISTADLSDAYDQEIRFVDHYVGKTLALLRDRGVLDDTILILTSDHGEEFDDHSVEIRSRRSAKGRLHGHSFYDELLRVPLLIRYPHLVPQAKIETLARHIDILPTILDMAAIGSGEAGLQFEGLSLLPLMSGGADHGEPRLAVSERNLYGAQKRSVRTDQHKLIVDYDNGEIELYDLSRDSAERLNLAKSEKNVVDQMQGMLDAWAERMGPLMPPQPYPIPKTREDVERLRALGYIH